MCAQNRMTGEQAEKRMELLKEMFARYAEIDGGPYIMEMMKQLNEDTLLDSEDCEKLMGRLTIYNEKLYRDALTGAYNRRFYEDEVRGMKERAGVSSRCMPLVQSGTEGTCPVCGRKCTTDIYWGVAY